MERILQDGDTPPEPGVEDCGPEEGERLSKVQATNRRWEVSDKGPEEVHHSLKIVKNLRDAEVSSRITSHLMA